MFQPSITDPESLTYWLELGRAVAAHLPTISGGWTAKPFRGFTNRVEITNNAGLSFRFGKSDNYAERERIVVNHFFEYKHLPSPSPNIRITLSGKREPKAIARDIENRFLPQLGELSRAVEKERARIADRDARFAEDLKVLREAGGDLFTIERRDRDNTEAHISRSNGEAGYYIRDGRATPNSVRLHLDSLDIEEAATILRALRALRDARKGVNEDEATQEWRRNLAA